MNTKSRSTLMSGTAAAALVAVLAACQGSSGDGSTLASVTQPAASAAGSATTLADAVEAQLREEGRSTAPMPVGDVADRMIEGPGGDIPVRIYTPTGSGPFPVIVYYHGGGWVLADLDTHDASARALATQARAIVVSTDYRHAPEHKFPAAQEDAVAAYRWAVENATSFVGDASRMAVAGESAGGNLVAHGAMTARD